MAEMMKQYLLEIQFPEEKAAGKWKYGAAFDKGIGNRFYSTLTEAKAAKDRLLRKFNRDFEYSADGKRREVHAIGGIGVAVVADKKIDDMCRIVAWRIRVREVTPFELVECSECVED